MTRCSGISRVLAAGAAAVVSTLAFHMPSRAGFTPEQLAGFEVTHLRGVVNAVLPKQKVIEVIDPEGHQEIVTVGIDMAPLRLQKGDRVDISLLDGLVVDLERSKATTLSFDREDIIMPMDMGPLKKGMRMALASGTARVLIFARSEPPDGSDMAIAILRRPANSSGSSSPFIHSLPFRANCIPP